MRTVIAFSFCLVMALAVMTQAISDPEPLRVETNQLQADTGIFETSEDVAELRKREDQNPDGRRGKLETEEGDKKKKSKRPRKPESVNKKKNKKPRKLKTKKNNDNGKGTRKLKTKKNNGKGPRKLKNNGKGPRKLQKKGQKTRTMNKKPKTNKKPSELSGRPRKTKKLEGTHKLPEILKFPKRKNRKNLKGGMVRGDTNNKRECKPKRKCNALSGECRQKTEGCLNGEVEATGRGKFCSKSTCVCCYAGDDSCANTKKCDKKGGTCQTSDAGCTKFKTGAKWCSGSGCGCCFGGTTTCKAKKKCTKKGGVCQSSSATCKGSIFTKGFCKGGSDCVCCVKEDGESEVTWSYLGADDGPEFWGENFPICDGEKQSPVDIKTANTAGEFSWTPFGFKEYNVLPIGGVINNNGHTVKIQLDVSPAPSVQGGDLGHKYNLVQLHFHWGASDFQGSEHTVDGKQYPGEIHLVHFREDYGNLTNAINYADGLAVLGIFMEISDKDNPKLDSIIDALPDVINADDVADITPFPLSNLLPEGLDDFWRYFGSLTTPSCNEIVVWTVFMNAISVSSKQMASFRTLLDEGGDALVDNFRPTQPLNGRVVYSLAETAHWTYEDDTGPEFWSKYFPLCGGQSQSPVALSTATSTRFLAPATTFTFTGFDATPQRMYIVNNGHTAQVMLDMGVGVAIPTISGGNLDGDYNVLQFHLHWGSVSTRGSEHTIDGASFAAELHIVTYKASYGDVGEAVTHADGLAVVGIMLQAGGTGNANLNNIVSGLPKIITAKTEAELTPFALNILLPANTESFFRYQGSLTTPPCNEIVIWSVMTTPIQISEAQLNEFRKLEDESALPIVDNFRPVQPLNGRVVQLN